MKVLCSSVLSIEAVVVFLATALAASNGSVSNSGLGWICGLVLIFLLILAVGMLRRPWGIAFGWVMQVLVLATSVVVGWSMLIVGAIFVILWFLAVRNGTRVDALRAAAADQSTSE